MAWSDFFRSRYVRSLEAELASIRQKHAEETERTKTLHTQELERAITEGNRGWAEADRLRQYLIPGLATSTRGTEPLDKTPNTEEVAESGTPFQKLARKMLLDDEKRYKAEEAARKAKEAQPATVPAQETH